jgi:PhnB protein
MATRTKKRSAKKTPARKAAPKRSAPKRKVVQPIPAGYHSVTPYLCIDGATEAIAFYKKAFGAKERMRMDAPGGKIGHAEIMIGDSIIMMADEFPEMEFRSPKARGGTPVTLHIYVKNVDQAFPRAIEAGATVKQPVKNQFYGDRSGTLEDPFGHIWHLSTHVEELSMKEIRKRGEEAMKGSG